MSDRDFLGSSALAEDPPQGFAARLKLPSLHRAKSDNDLQARRSVQQAARRKEEVPALPPLQLDVLRQFQPHSPLPDTARQSAFAQGSRSPRSPRTPTAASVQAEAQATRPGLPGRATTGDIPQRRPVAGGSAALPFPGPPVHGTQPLSRPSTAGSTSPGFSFGESRSTLVTSPSLGSLDSRSAISELTGSYASSFASGPRRKDLRYQRAFEAQSGYVQDNLLAQLRLGAVSTNPMRPRRLSDVILGGLPKDVFPLLGRTLGLPQQVLVQLAERQKNLAETARANDCDVATLQVQVALRDCLYRMRTAAAEEANRRVRRPYDKADRASPGGREKVEAAALRGHENDLARFLMDATNLREVLEFFRYPLTHETREALRQSSRALPIAEVKRILGALTLEAQQAAELARYVSLHERLAALLRPQASLDSISTSEQGSVYSP